MKKTLFITTLLLTTVTYSQYNLEFSKVLNFELTTNQSATVPDGKVWKIENSNGEVFMSTTSTEYGIVMTSDGTGTAGVLWIAAGSSIINTSLQNRNYSIIEFSLVEIGSSFGGDTGSSSSSIGNSIGVINIEFGPIFTNQNAGDSMSLGNIIVPEGEIWHIQYHAGAAANDTTPNPEYGNTSMNIYVDGFAVNSSAHNGIFLSEGTYEVRGRCAGNCTYGQGWYARGKIGGIKYNAN